MEEDNIKKDDGKEGDDITKDDDEEEDDIKKDDGEEEDDREEKEIHKMMAWRKRRRKCGAKQQILIKKV